MPSATDAWSVRCSGLCNYGEYGQPEPLAVLDTILVDPEHRHHGVATLMHEQLVRNLRALRIERLRTEVAWNEQELLAFFHRMGFSPVPRLVLEADLTEGGA